MDGFPIFFSGGDTSVWVECKGGLTWEDVPGFPELQRYEDAVNETSDEVLLIPQSPRIIKKANGYSANILGFIYDGTLWSHAELGRWSGKVGFCHSGNSWKDRMSGEYINGRMGDGQSPEVKLDWRSATQIVRGKRVAFFKGFADSEIEEWGASS